MWCINLFADIEDALPGPHLQPEEISIYEMQYLQKLGQTTDYFLVNDEPVKKARYIRDLFHGYQSKSSQDRLRRVQGQSRGGPTKQWHCEITLLQHRCWIW